MIYIYIFVFCIYVDRVCEREVEVKPDYDACTAAQIKYMKDHEDEDYYTLCKPLPEMRT